ncbi:MAG: rhodanese-like domain-containing protein [Gammaproteobacteria bacterium]|nr:rhodanese-like domain-containing protein [Gammaproteobacteria bacterium]
MSLIKEIEVTELAQLKENGETIRVIDIRQPAELNSGVIPGAEPLPMHIIPLRINEFKRDEKLVMVCRSGARSAQACMFMQQQGYDNVYNLRGGMMAWARSGLDLGLPQAV